MDRRTFVASAIALIVAPLAAEAQQTAAVPRIGFLSDNEPPGRGARYLDALRGGLTELGYADGKNLAIEYRWAAGKEERLHTLAQELVRAGVQVIVALEPPSTRAAVRATRTVPIVARFSE